MTVTTTTASPQATILIVDDERNTREGLGRALQGQYHVLLAESAALGLEILQTRTVDVVVTDLRMPGMDGMSFIKQVSASEDAPIIIMLTAYGSVQTAVDAMRVGAYDYLAKPVNLDNLEMLIVRGLEQRRLRSENAELRRLLDKRYGFEGIVGNSGAMVSIFESLRQVATARSTVMLTGESGTGKELLAHAMHRLSPRADKPFIVVHCAALNANLLESELFGHEKGAFTGAGEKRIGRFEKADGGTLFLDEIGEIDAATQIKLLRVLDNRTFERVGGNTPIQVDVRLVAATNRDLKAAVAAGIFREDLYYRLNVVTLHLPPLRERLEDVPLLLNHYLRVFSEENGKPLKGFTSEALKMLMAYPWPGNVRELRNTVERMVVMARGTSLTLGDVPAEVRGGVAAALEARAATPGSGGDGSPVTGAPISPATPADPDRTLDMNTHEKNLIIRALKECDGNRALTARKLGIGRRTLYRKLAVYGLESL